MPNLGWEARTGSVECLDLQRCPEQGGVRSVERNRGAPIKAVEHQWELRSAIPVEVCWKWEGGVTSAACNIETTIQTRECWWELISFHRKLWSAQRGVSSVAWNRGVPILTERIKECLSQWWSTERVAIDHGMKWKSFNLGWGAPMGMEECLSLGRSDARGYQVAHECVIDECSGVLSKPYQRGWATGTLVFILWRHNHGHHFPGILR